MKLGTLSHGLSFTTLALSRRMMRPICPVRSDSSGASLQWSSPYFKMKSFEFGKTTTQLYRSTFPFTRLLQRWITAMSLRHWQLWTNQVHAFLNNHPTHRSIGHQAVMFFMCLFLIIALFVQFVMYFRIKKSQVGKTAVYPNEDETGLLSDPDNIFWIVLILFSFVCMSLSRR